MDVRHMMKLAENMYRYCKNTDIAILPDKESVLCRLYKLIGDGLLFSNKFSPGMTPQRMLTRVHLALGLPIVRTISQESLYRKLTARGQNWIDSITVYEQRVRDCQYSEELIWLYYSLANFNIEVRRYSLAKNYAGKCIHEARKCENFRWAINGYLLLTKISVHQKNKNEVRRQLRLAISTAKNIENEELDYFLQTCLTVINECTLERDKPDQLLKQRQQEIVQLITPYEKKREAWLLFDNIRQRPPDRRLPIIPGLVDTDEYDRIERLKEERRQAKRKHKSKPARQRGMEAEELISAYLTSSTEVYL
ncbi:hypothetical protein HHI36_009547 [Cryptolaemus montrouzieri]|uniref:Uncharacterized protein n=1 Tax=Cryptolaemus montrouzieri TaxID=559131 RepID=A0ABD2MG11_9CUCU